MGMRVIIILAVVFCVTVFLVVGYNRRTGKGVLMSSIGVVRHRHPVIRIIGAVGCIACVAVVGIGSWLTAGDAYGTVDSNQPVMMRAPTAEPSPINDSDDLKDVRFIIYLVLAEQRYEHWPPRPLGVWEIDLRLTAHQKLSDSRVFSWDRHTFEVIYSLQIKTYEVPIFPEPELTGRFEIYPTIPRSTRSQSIDVPSADDIKSIWRQVVSRPMWSIAAGQYHRLEMLAFAVRVAPDDPLERVAVEAYLARPRMTRLVHRYDVPSHAVVSRAGALGEHIGFSTFILLLAAVLGAQCFRRRCVGLAVMMLAVVLFVAALDRSILAMHADRLADTTASIEHRRIAAARVGDTFFFRKTARRLMEETDLEHRTGQ